MIDIVIPSYCGEMRVRALLESIERYDPIVKSLARVTVFEDPSTLAVRRQYSLLLTRFPWIKVVHLPKWSNMHGAAQFAFDWVTENPKCKWIVYLGDDVLVTPKCLSNVCAFLLCNRLETVGLVQIPYWNACDLSLYTRNEEVRVTQPLLRCKEEMYNPDTSWLKRVPRNPHWDGPGHSVPYVNVNGAGFACRTDAFHKAGGFARDTWCLDESLSLRIWERTKYSIVTLPGPCLVHFFAAADFHPPHNLDTHEAWTRSTGLTKEQANRLCRAAMAQRQEPVLEEMKRAHYY